MISPASLRRGDRMQDLQDCPRNPSFRDQGSSCSPVGPCLWALLFSGARGTAGSSPARPSRPGPAALLQPYSQVWVGWGVLPSNLGTTLTRVGEHLAPPAGGACWSGAVPMGGTEEEGEGQPGHWLASTHTYLCAASPLPTILNSRGK